MNKRLPTILLLAALFTGGCGTLKRADHVPNWKTSSEREMDPLPVPNRFGPFTTWQKLNPKFWIGNSDEPEAPEWYRPNDSGRNWKWHVRNPFHNLTFYVIGIADQEFTRWGNHPNAVFNPADGWSWSVSHADLLPLPYLSYKRNSFQFYFGWRERGNFGIKFKGLRLRPKDSPAIDKAKAESPGAK
jgi:hypothetical protein